MCYYPTSEIDPLAPSKSGPTSFTRGDGGSPESDVLRADEEENKSAVRRQTARTRGPNVREKTETAVTIRDSRIESQPLPGNLPAERCVLGALIEDDSLLPEVLASGLRSEDFQLSDHRRLFQAIELLHARSAPVDCVSVAEQLGNRNGDYPVIADLMNGVVIHQDHILHHAAIVRRKSQLRGLLRLGEWISEAVMETADPKLLIAQIRNILDTFSEDDIRA